MNSEQQRMVAPADRPHFVADDHPDETTETIWENTADVDAVLEVYVGANHGRAPRSWEEKTGQRKYVIRAHTTRALPSEFDQAIQQTSCNEPQCSGKKRICRDNTHRKDIIGGYGPYLKNVGAQIAPKLHPALDAAQSEKRVAEARAMEAAKMAEVAQQQATIAKGQAVLAQQEVEARSKSVSDREALLMKREQELAEREARMKASAKTKDS